MKKIIVAILAISIFASLFGCTKTERTESVSDKTPSGTTTQSSKQDTSETATQKPESQKEQNQSDKTIRPTVPKSEDGELPQEEQELNDILDEASRTAFELSVSDFEGTPTQEKVTISLNLPEEWKAENYSIVSDHTVAQIKHIYTFSDSTNILDEADKLVPNAEITSDITIGDFPTRYYHVQTEITQGSITGFENTIYYFINTGKYLMNIEFYPMVGIGVGTQREEFQNILSTLKVHE